MLRLKLAAGAFGASAVVGAGALALAAGPADGTSPEAARIAALRDGPPIALSENARRTVSSAAFGAVGPRADGARRVPTPPGADGSWAVVPATDGACLVTGDDTVTCGTGKQVNAGSALSFAAPDAMPDRLSPEQLRELREGGSGAVTVPAGSSLGAAEVAGLAPDGVTSIRFAGAAGEVLASATVDGNVYRATKVDLDAARTLELVSRDGGSRSVTLPGR